MKMNRIAWFFCTFVAVCLAVAAGFYLSKMDGSAAVLASESPQLGLVSTGGPVIPGLCVLSQNAVYANAKIGQAANARYRELAASLQSQLQPERVAIQDEAKRLESERASLPPRQFQQEQQALAERFRAFQAKANLGSRELEATRVKVLKQISALANPVVGEAYQSHRCGALFSRETMLAGNPAMDLTPQVVRGLDARVTTTAFVLDHLSASPVGEAAPH